MNTDNFYRKFTAAINDFEEAVERDAAEADEVKSKNRAAANAAQLSTIERAEKFGWEVAYEAADDGILMRHSNSQNSRKVLEDGTFVS